MGRIDISHQEYPIAIELLRKANPDLTKVDITIDFGVNHSQSKIIRDFVGSIFEFHGIKTPWGGRFILITDELINNAIEHGSSLGDLDTCIIQAGKNSLDEFCISLEVHDTGNGKDAKKPQEIISIKEDEHSRKGVYMEKRGRGLFHITEKLVDRLEFRESPKGGLAVRIEKNIPPAAQA